MKNIFKRFEDIMVAAAFAETGEFETAREFLRQNKNSNQRVLLGIEEMEIDPRIIRYALNLCKRMGARLEIVHVVKTLKPGDVPQSLLETSFDKAAGINIDYSVICGNEPLEQEVAKCAAERRDILCVVFGSAIPQEKGPKTRMQKYLSGIVEKLKCPVVVYSEVAET